MIFITRTMAGITIQQEDTVITIDPSAVPSTLGAIIAALVDCSNAAGQARREGYEDGLLQGREQARIEHETSMRIAERQTQDLVDALGLGALAQAA